MNIRVQYRWDYEKNRYTQISKAQTFLQNRVRILDLRKIQTCNQWHRRYFYRSHRWSNTPYVSWFIVSILQWIQWSHNLLLFIKHSILRINFSLSLFLFLPLPSERPMLLLLFFSLWPVSDSEAHTHKHFTLCQKKDLSIRAISILVDFHQPIFYLIFSEKVSFDCIQSIGIVLSLQWHRFYWNVNHFDFA